MAWEGEAYHARSSAGQRHANARLSGVPDHRRRRRRRHCYHAAVSGCGCGCDAGPRRRRAPARGDGASAWSVDGGGGEDQNEGKEWMILLLRKYWETPSHQLRVNPEGEPYMGTRSRATSSSSWDCVIQARLNPSPPPPPLLHQILRLISRHQFLQSFRLGTHRWGFPSFRDKDLGSSYQSGTTRPAGS